MPIEERISASGHENVLAEHASTFEVTTDDYLTKAGDCILGIDADRAPTDFDPEFVAAAKNASATITATLQAADRELTITGRGDPRLTFENERSMVGRTSNYVDDRTIMVEADAAAADLDREFVAALANGADLTVVLRVE
ncbi:hypothetical protein HTSR_1386 [Halodesulfurarchaeum formicicum]|uniref:DUF371 domain-containing protein n=1 Tax=Halodesulfurarchaeum formicicum TaxID=1873524 RepID=A0A1D8S5D7_9EURY|nr:DUF371 domain-containing protein [Halodesulfurarchaeum formicicum]AOW80562.1 hypothetical protein HTSR_1386 [Halodesulfurarchaeum formicicum]APE95901.1 hypothetical protein HSR6_1458 [Halodesulfurarchaeum formicicum]